MIRQLLSVVAATVSSVTLAPCSSGAEIRYCGTGSSCAVWIFFSDKPDESGRTEAISPRALARRKAAGFHGKAYEDRGITSRYLQSIHRMGGTLRHCYKWENAASFDIPVSALEEVKRLPYVAGISPVGTFRSRAVSSPGLKKRLSGGKEYGYGIEQMRMLAIPDAHTYLSHRFPGTGPGTGVRIAIFDGGFRLRHRCFRHLFTRGAILGERDFVDRDTSVEDPDSVFSAYRHPYLGNDFHGSAVAALLCGLDPPYFTGVAWGAEYILARTEDSYCYDDECNEMREMHGEEDNWAAAVVWAESLGVDIISSSVAYRTEFEDTVIVPYSGGFDTIVDYEGRHLDGSTSVISRAARAAVERGILIVNSVGNEGQIDGDTSLDVPSDVDGVVAVGSVGLDGTASFFSSRGPTADGRIKPDLVAPGEEIRFPDPYSYESTGDTLGSGTSFAAPFISGILAILMQANPGLDAAGLRERLYRHCLHPKKPGTTDNLYGRGIPDALGSCMQPGEIFLSATDTGGKPVTGAVVVAGPGDTLSRTDERGNCFFTSNAKTPVRLRFAAGDRNREFTVDSAHHRIHLGPCSLQIAVLDSRSNPLPSFSCEAEIGSTVLSLIGDSLGKTLVSVFFPDSVHCTISKTGYRNADTSVLLDENGLVLRISLDSSDAGISTGRHSFHTPSKSGSVLFRIPLPATPATHRLHASVYSISGVLVWRRSWESGGTETYLGWNLLAPGGSPAAPGTYLVRIECDGAAFSRKLFIGR